MALPTAYLTSTKNLDGILSAIQTAQAPSRFTINFLANLGYKSSSDRLIINVLKALGFLNADGSPTDRYYRYLDQTEARKVLAEGLRDAYADLFQLNRNANTMTRTDVKHKLKTLTQGQASDAVLMKMAGTFSELARRADFTQPHPPNAVKTPESKAPAAEAPTVDGTPDVPMQAGTPDSRANHEGNRHSAPRSEPDDGRISLNGLVYSIQIHLPESRDQSVYDALFRSLKTHLLR